MFVVLIMTSNLTYNEPLMFRINTDLPMCTILFRRMFTILCCVALRGVQGDKGPRPVNPIQWLCRTIIHARIFPYLAPFDASSQTPRRATRNCIRIMWRISRCVLRVLRKLFYRLCVFPIATSQLYQSMFLCFFLSLSLSLHLILI